MHHNDDFRFLVLISKCLVSSIDCFVLLLLLLQQFPCASSNRIFPTRHNMSLFLARSRIVGLSLFPPHCLCIPKYFSGGSWHILLLKKHGTPGILKIANTRSIKDNTESTSINHSCNNNYELPDMLIPSCVSRDSIIKLMASFEKPILAFALFSHVLK